MELKQIYFSLKALQISILLIKTKQKKLYKKDNEVKLKKWKMGLQTKGSKLHFQEKDSS